MRRFLLLACVLLGGCAHQQAITTNLATRQKYISQSAKRYAFAGDGSLSLVSSRRTGSAAMVLQAQWPDKLRLELQNPVGARELLLLFNSDVLFLDNPNEAQATLVDLKKAGAMDAVAALMPFPLGGADPLRLWQSILFARAPTQSDLELDADTGDLLRWQIAEGQADAAMSVTYEMYREQQGARIPLLVRAEILSGPNKGSRLVLRWRDIEPSIARPQFLQLQPSDWQGRSLNKLP